MSYLAPHVPATLAEVIECLKTSRLDATRKRDLISATTRVAKMLHRNPEEVPASLPELRRRLLAIHPRTENISARTMANIKAALAKALVITRAASRPLPKVEPNEAWQVFLAHAPANHNRHGLSRFARYCTMRGLPPADVGDETLRQFEGFLDTTLLTKDPRELCQDTAQNWNVTVRHARLNLLPLTAPKSDHYRARPIETYPASLQDEIKRYIDRLAHVDRFSEDGPDRALRPTSLRNIRAQLRQFFDALVETGADPEDLTSLELIVTADNMKRAFRQLAKRNGGEIPVGLQNIASTLLSIARHHLKLPPKEIDSIQAIKKRALKPYEGMTAKNRARLAQIDTPRHRAALFNLPFILMKRAKSNPTSPRARLAAMRAVAIMILMVAPIRVKNLAALDIDRHLRVEGAGKHRRYSIWVEGSEVKNGVSLELDLGSEVSGLLADYLDGFRHQRGAPAGTALFPNGSGASRSPCNFGKDISDTIRRETGLEINPHLFRHLAAKLYLERNPGDYETVRRLLGHKKLDTTLNAYASFDNRRAQGRYHDAVLNARNSRRRK